jgi:hypothetical protein
MTTKYFLTNLNKSFIHFINKKNTHRNNIKSILTTEKKKYFLTKECRAELIGKDPFSRQKKYEFLNIIEGDKNFYIRTAPTGIKANNIEINTTDENKKYITESEIEYLNFEKTYEIVASNSLDNIFCEITYNYENKKYNLISKCEYINYNTNKNDENYLQPVLGYVPFILKNNLSFGYVTFYATEKNNENIQFVLNEQRPIVNLDNEKNLILFSMKKIVSFFFFFLIKNNFSKIINVNDFKIKFFKYNQS